MSDFVQRDLSYVMRFDEVMWGCLLLAVTLVIHAAGLLYTTRVGLGLISFPLDQKSLADRTEAVRIATVQYKAGRRELLWVAQLQAVQLAAEANIIKLVSAQRTNRVRLYQVLGGSFDAAPPTAISAR